MAADDKPDDDKPTSNITRNALVLIAVILSGSALLWAAPILTPLALAIFLMLMIDAMARDLHGRIPALGADASLGAAIITCAIAFALIVFVVGAHSAGFAAKLLAYQPKLNTLLVMLAKTLHARMPHTVNALVAGLDPGHYLPIVAGSVQTLGQYSLLVLLYLGFLLASRHGFERKAVRLFHGREGRHEALQVFLRVRDSLERYLWIQTVCGGFIAIGSWVLMMLIGLDSAFFWAFLIFVLNYIPIVGAAVGIFAPALFALLQFPTLWPGVFLGVALLALAFTVGNILMPRMQGRQLNIDPVMILLSLGFWGTVWGPTGMFLSTPLTILVMVILAQFDGTRWIAVLLSADGDPHSVGAIAPQPAPVASRNSEVSAL
ncbi:MAG TPA: AI-2E family transporter [Caulobacteraceae bacterium]|nr:AI-2E family transporter [Caulobacteraceae bacterium]